ncbi:MAG: GGDEF domain-containing protein [Planctomycetes bacterium]|nr:GGDEF domain-containing protein [Planctomycetota bacterium]
MSPLSVEPAAGSQTILLLDHRGAESTSLRARLQERGWRVRTSRAPEASAALLDEGGATAAIVAPLTLSHDTSEWQLLLPRLSPQTELPWLLLPWEDTRPSRFAELVHDPATLADWLPYPYSSTEAEARIRNLLRFQRMVADQEARAAALQNQLIADHKTGLANDRHFRERLEEEFSRSERHGAPLSMLLLDIDDFKSINDQSNYEFGDAVLRSVAEAIEHSVRNIDLPARIGGDEFGVLMPNTNLEEGVGVGARILATAEGLIVSDDEFGVDVQVSIGVANFDGRGLADSSQLFLRANEALKAAKSGGKNRVCFFDPLRRTPSGAPALTPPQSLPSEGQ